MSNKKVEEIIGKLLTDRGIPHKEQEAFRHPDFERDTHSPWLLPGMETAVTRLLLAREKQEKIIVFGDYDADGVPATALLVRIFKRLGFEQVEGVIPTRTQGYGLTDAVIQEILATKPAIVITVDNGTVAKAEIAQLKKAGVDVIVVDHHEPQEGKVATATLAIINPKMPKSAYPFREPCACALAWKLGCAVAEKLYGDVAGLKWELDLVGLSTIADMVPLVGENRVLAQYGLKVLRKTRNLGLQALMEVGGVKPESVSAGDVGFKLAPRINAPSRMHNELLNGEHSSLRLLLAETATDALEIAQHLNKQNMDRQQLVDVHIEQAKAQIADTSAPVIVAYHEEWSSGVIGLVASRLVEQYKRPVVVLAPEGDEIKGSVRSIEGVHALELLEAGTSELERFGGHAKAAGLTLKGDREKFRALLEGYMVEQGLGLEELAARAERTIDAELLLSDVQLELAEAIEELEPFGVGFPTPLFRFSGKVKSVRNVGAEGKHVSFFATDGTVDRKAIAFSYRGPRLEETHFYAFKANVCKEEWQSVESVVLQVRGVEVLDNAPQTA